MLEPAFYAASLRALRFVEARTPTRRRFGADADALWRIVQGHLTAADRIDLLLRDADVEYPGAFAARTAFALRGVSEDDPFGPHWARLAPPDADALWRGVVADAPAPDVPSALTACAAAWGVALRPLDVPSITPTTRLTLAGPSAIASVAAAFARGRDLSWSDQVTCVATPPAHRHLAGLAAALLASAKPTRIVSSDAATAKITFDVKVVSGDADAHDAAAIARL